MADIIITNNQKQFQSVEDGFYDAVCIKQIDLGTQKTEFKGQKSERRKVRIVWELPKNLMDDGRPFIISKNYTLCLWGEATLKKDLQNWRGKVFTEEELNKFNLSNVLNKSCKLTISNDIIDNNKKITRIVKISPNPKFIIENTFNEILSFSLDNFEQEVFDKLTDYEKKLIMQSKEYQALKNNITNENMLEDTDKDIEEEVIPF